MPDIDKLQIKVSASVANAKKSLNSLTTVINKMNKVLKDTGLKDTYKTLNKISKLSFSNLAPLENLTKKTREYERANKKATKSAKEASNAAKDVGAKATKAFEKIPDTSKLKNAVEEIKKTSEEITPDTKESPKPSADAAEKIKKAYTEPTAKAIDKVELLKLKLKGVDQQIEALSKKKTQNAGTLANLLDKRAKVGGQLTEAQAPPPPAPPAPPAPKGWELVKLKLAEAKAQLSAMKEKLYATSPAAEKLGNTLAKIGKKGKSAFKSVLKQVSQVAKIVLIYGSAFKAVMLLQKGFQEGLQNIAKYSEETANNMNQLSTASLYLKNSVGAAAYPIIVQLLPTINALTDALVKAFNAVNQFISAWSGATTYIRAKKYLKEFGEQSKKTAEQVKRYFAGMDEITVIGDMSGKGGTQEDDPTKMFETVDIAAKTEAAVENIKENIATLKSILFGAAIVLGALFTFSGANIPLGIGLMIIGAVRMGKAVKENWDKTGNTIKDKVAIIEGIVGVAFLVLGAILCFSGANVPLGLGAIALGAALSINAIAEDWNGLPDKVKTTLKIISGIIGGVLAVVGIVLCCTGVVPLGIALIVAGIGVIAAVTIPEINWDFVKEKTVSVLQGIAGVLLGLEAILGVILLLSPGTLPLGIALIYGAMKGTHKLAEVSDNPVVQWVKNMMNGAISIVERGVNWIVRKLNKISWDVPDWVPGIGGKTWGFDISEIYIPRLKYGGFPDGEDGLFYANHNEMVGRFSNGRTAVANNDQITRGISDAVKEGNRESIDLVREGVELLRRINEKDLSVNVGTKNIANGFQRDNKRNGRTLVPVG